MTSSTDASTVPDELRRLVDRALRDGGERELAIEGLERHLADGGERSTEVLLALATLTYEDAASLVLTRIGQASAAALELVDEAIAQQDPPAPELASLRATFVAALEREQRRERRLRSVLCDPAKARPVERMALAHQILMSGEDDWLAAQLMALEP